MILTVLFFGVTNAVRPPPHDGLIVAVDDYLEAFSSKSGYTKIELDNYYGGLPAGLAYDPSSQILYFSDKGHEDIHIFSTSLNQTNLESKHDVQRILQKHEDRAVENLSFDPVNGTLFWVNTKRSSINRIEMKAATSNSTENPGTEVLHFLDQDRPRGLVTDPCTIMLYWSNWNQKHPTIERSHMNGSQREIIVEEDLNMPHALALDAKEQKLYWVSNGKHFNSFHIERSYVDGSERQLVYAGTKQYVFSMTVSEDYIYWTDWEEFGLWSLPKEGGGNQPTLLRRYDERPMAVVVFQQQLLNCDVITQVTHHSQAPSVQMTTGYTEAAGYEMIDQSQTPIDTIKLCKGYCFNGGRCSQTQTGQLDCKCRDGFTGARCENKIDGGGSSSSSSSSSETWAAHDISALSEMKRQLSSALVCIAVTCGALVIVVIALSIRVHQLSRRPRIRRRFFGPSAGKSGKSGKPQDAAAAAASGPTMDIENCCNMNECETPCTEPPSRTPKFSRADRPNDGQKLLGGCQF